MEVAKILSEGETQLVELPKGFRFDEDEVFVNRVGDTLILVPKQRNVKGMLETLNLFTDDFMEDTRKDLSTQKRILP